MYKAVVFRGSVTSNNDTLGDVCPDYPIVSPAAPLFPARSYSHARLLPSHSIPASAEWVHPIAGGAAPL